MVARDVEGLKNYVRRHPLYQAWHRRRENTALARWAREEPGRPLPHLLKQHLVRAYARRFATPTLVETGTFLGEMVEAMAPHFEHIYSIELDQALHRRAVARLAHLRNVTLRLGDSGELLGEVLQEVEGSCVLWLDGHYSAGVTARGIEDSPIRRELEHIFAQVRPGDILLIDDARCFDGTNGYPTLDELVGLLQRRRGSVVAVAEDVVRATPCWP